MEHQEPEESGVYCIIPETVDEALTKWDAGELVFTVEMGGLGPAYEQCIQVLAFELMRALRGYDVNDEKQYPAMLREVDIVVKALNPKYQFTSAQVGAATNLAVCVLERGYRTALRDPKVKDRLIQVSKNFQGEGTKP